MNTPEQYIENKIPVIPCKRNTRIPIGSDWQHKPIDINRFNPGDNIGWHLLEQTDIDIDNPICHKFLDVIKTRCCAVYGRKSNPQSHLLFTGKNEYEKWTMPAFNITISNTQVRPNIRYQMNNFTFNIGTQISSLDNKNKINTRIKRIRYC